MSSIQGPSDPNIGRIHPQGEPTKKTSSHTQKENQGDSTRSRTSDASLEAFDASGAVLGGDTAPESISQERISMGPVRSSSDIDEREIPTTRDELLHILYFIHMSVTLNNSKIYKDDIVFLEKIVAKLRPLIKNEGALNEIVREMYREIRDHEIESGFTIPIKPKPEK